MPDAGLIHITCSHIASHSHFLLRTIVNCNIRPDRFERKSRCGFSAFARSLFFTSSPECSPQDNRTDAEKPRLFVTPLVVPAGETIRIHLINKDATTEEFDSLDLMTEKLVTPGGQITIALGPVQVGNYHFMGEFHPLTAQGQMIAEAR